jgi:hypothetical protein
LIPRPIWAPGSEQEGGTRVGRVVDK